MSSPNGLPTVYEEEGKQEDLDMEDPPAAEDAAAVLGLQDLQNSGADHSAVAGSQTASSWGWPEECRFRDPVQQQLDSVYMQRLASLCTVYLCVVVVFYLRKRPGP